MITPSASARRSFAITWAIAFALLVFVERRWTWIPAYHDGRIHFDFAWSLREHPRLPFVESLDTGHPPLVSSLLALAWMLPAPRLLMMHLLSWAAAALFVAAVFEVARRSFGSVAAIFVAGLLFVHPVFAAQALQLNLDLFHAAFAWLAVLGVVTGDALLVAVAGSAAALAKLNGLFTDAGLVLWAAGSLVASRERSARRILSAFVPLAAPVAVFAAYHAVKLLVVGHLFATAEFQDDNLTFVDDPAQYVARLAQAFDQIFGFHNPNDWAGRLLCVVGIGALTVLVARKVLVPAAPICDAIPFTPPSTKDAFYRPLSPISTLTLVVVVALTHVGLWSLRSYPSLVRYFLLVYPALYLVLAASIAIVASRIAPFAFAAFGLPLAVLFAVQARPTETVDWFPDHARALLFPPTYVPTNYENSLELADLMATLQRTASYIERTRPSVARIRAKWPFEAYLTDPRHGMVRGARVYSPEDPEVVVFTSVDQRGRAADEADLPSGFRLERVERIGRVWTALAVREGDSI